MCGRYFIDRSAELKTVINEMKTSVLVKLWEKTSTIVTEGEIRPTDVVPVIALNRRGESSVFPMKWGYTNPHKGGKLLLNARSETAYQKPTFKYDRLNHRCIIPASYYFEWNHFQNDDGTTQIGDRYMIQPKGEEITWLCGLYHLEENFPTFVVLTREPGADISEIHNRMPLILPSALIDDWIRPGISPDALLDNALIEMIIEKG